VKRTSGVEDIISEVLGREFTQDLNLHPSAPLVS